MQGKTTITTDHDEIRRWVEERLGKPATVRGTGKNEPGILRINFPGYNEARLESITWDQFFKKFDEKRLAFLYQDKTRSGEPSRFFKFVGRERREEDQAAAA
jgi:hypothetical protein